MAEIKREQQRRQRTRRLVAALQMKLNIPGDDSLVLAIGEGCERNNREALEVWVTKALENVKADSPQELCSLLAARLTTQLYEFQAH